MILTCPRFLASTGAVTTVIVLVLSPVTQELINFRSTMVWDMDLSHSLIHRSTPLAILMDPSVGLYVLPNRNITDPTTAFSNTVAPLANFYIIS